mgnify:FL=1
MAKKSHTTLPNATTHVFTRIIQKDIQGISRGCLHKYHYKRIVRTARTLLM